ncbi:S1C family serine protease [Psychromonas sp. PT13]|uniref:S1C family serine protease n=1 Tax=Psychromonas sp. PT13 TaxID=3439547 RepID=UPI003EBA0ED7
MRLFLLLFVLISTPSLSWASATSLFSELKQNVFQIRVIDIASGDKFTIGSGFQISQNGYVATNFHVVSPYIHEPEKYRLEFMRTESVTTIENKEVVQPAALLTFDVIHDLALLKIDNPTSEFLLLSDQRLNKGERIYSMGNPLDLGMSIVEGNYNGLLQASRYQKILFSGALNPGMSGGPAMNEEGHVIGINVSTQGSDISYLVPVTYLQKLVDGLAATSADLTTDSTIPAEAHYQQLIHQSLFDDQQAFYGKLLNPAFKTKKLGNVKVPSKITSSLKCWGQSKNKKEDSDKLKYQSIQQSCATEDEIYIASGVNLGQFYYNFEWVTSDELNPFQFYAEIEARFSHDTLNYTYQEKDITPFQCADNVIALAEHGWKISTCFRAYKDYPDLYDSQLVMASIDGEQSALVAKIGASAISKENTNLLFKRFMESISWNK